MEKAYSEIVGLPIVIEGAGKITRVTDVLIDTVDGRITAFFVDSGKNKLVAPIDVLFFGRALIISDHEDIIDTEDLIKAQEVMKSDIELLKSRVETKKGEYIGNIYDYYVDAKAFGLTKIVVYKSIFGFFKTPSRFIPARDIIEIKKGLVIVKNKYAMKHAKVEEGYKKLTPDPAG